MPIAYALCSRQAPPRRSVSSSALSHWFGEVPPLTSETMGKWMNHDEYSDFSPDSTKKNGD